MYTTISIFAGFILDLFLGDPYWMPHPVRAMGKGIQALEKKLRRPDGTPAAQMRAGALLVCMIVAVSILIPVLLLWLAYRLHPAAGLVLESFMCYQIMATKCLKVESMKVCRALRDGDVEKAREAVSMIVGRDTAVLDSAGIARTAIETVAENASDGVVAPFLFMALFGPAGGMLYKAVNTMDSMIGYKNETYMLFGRTAAKLDDILNFIPSRLTGGLMVLAAFFLPGMDGVHGWRILMRDRHKHASPNSAQAEAACAGALHLRLAGDAWYFGILHKKPFIGDDDRPVCPMDIKRANRLMFAAEGILMAGLAAALFLA